MTARDAVELCGLIRARTAIPIHYEGWSHFQQDRATIEHEFANAPADTPPVLALRSHRHRRRGRRVTPPRGQASVAPMPVVRKAKTRWRYAILRRVRTRREIVDGGGFASRVSATRAPRRR
jgi:hypothetical protein